MADQRLVYGVEDQNGSHLQRVSSVEEMMKGMDTHKKLEVPKILRVRSVIVRYLHA